MLRAVGLQKKYGQLDVLKGIDLEIASGEIVSIVGSSGAGKTTLLQLLGTLDKPDNGIVELDGVNPFQLSSKELARFRNTQIGFVFQFHQLLPEFTAMENVMMPALINGVSKQEAQQRALELLNQLGLADRATHQPSALSGGEQQRVAVARALVNKPKVVFADEPSGNLDSKNAKELHQLFFDLRRDMGQTFVIVTHNNQLAEMADRTLTMQDGLIVS
ncbi:MAG: lipoprotein ABC transporter ATP-binding protein [Candidatus Fluviicola riflensis]|nr:MAG: lipoprotein-releasing system ATP-binding protein LolD [Candidatus Fluviicola riflensis]OGS79487.1 MAG: lipoprotein ABC transporter ATP-binding protein [Candidatus Fluviicola riflensis]OGS86918.1 MAG: lipoprotein ABC transporter ATP-binding protein [Fluviicola sp. RIFCSPHIGHO2_01_FULL_43_53]OGS89709.1 MAG: lipoprotein ABC transporter ATP-binding protein [Fluviicola sp. RIFCSPHIGHO2_12_FULL_43_24]